MSPVESGPIRHPERYGTWSNPEDLADFTRAYFGLADRPTPVEVAAA